MTATGEPSAYDLQRARARDAISTEVNWRPIFSGDKANESMEIRRVARTNLAIAEAILTLAEAVRPAPVQVQVRVDHDAVQAAVRDALAKDGAA